MVVGVLALQGGFAAHASSLARLGVDTREIRTPDDLEGIDALIIPGGESTTIGQGVEREGLAEPLVEFARSGKPVLGTCAGMIMLDREHLDVLDIGVRRNAFGRQLASFETQLELEGETVDAVFIRAPWVEDVGDGIEVLAEVDGHPVAVRKHNVLAVAFHPELTQDLTLHRWLVDRVQAA